MHAIWHKITINLFFFKCLDLPNQFLQRTENTRKINKKQKTKNSMKAPKNCQGALDCSAPVLCKNLCRSHYMREWYAIGAKSGTRWCQKLSTTKFQGICGKKVHRSNLCSVHWRSAAKCKHNGCPRRVLLLGDHCPKHILSREPHKISSLCIVKKCQRVSIARRLCRKHYDEIKWEKRRKNQALRRGSKKNTIESYFPLVMPGDDEDDNDNAEEIACLRYVFETTNRIATWNQYQQRQSLQGNT